MPRLRHVTRSVLPAIIGLAAFAAPTASAWAQSRAQRDGWAADCAALGGSMNWDTGQCVGANSGGGYSAGGGYTAEQQAMLNLAGQMGSMFGSWIRQSFEQSARQAEADRIQRAWAAERAREQAAIAAEEQRRRNQALLANMQGTIGSSELGMRGVGSQGGLQMRRVEDMTFGATNPSAAADGATADPAQAAADAYIAALQAHDAAERALTVRQNTLAVGNQLVNEAARAVVALRESVNALPAGSEQRRAEEARLAEAEARLADALRLRDQAQRDADAARVEVNRTRQALESAEARRRALGGEASTQTASATSAQQPHTDTSVVDLRRPGVASDPSHTDTSVVDARGPIGSQFSNLPRLEEVENSPGRQAWLRGMDAVANSDYELAVPWFQTALQRDPTNAALARMVDGTQFVRDQRRLRASGAVAPAPASRVVAPTDADLELLREDLEAQASRIWETISLEERRQLRALDIEDEQYRQMLFMFPQAPQQPPRTAAPNMLPTGLAPGGEIAAPRQ